MGLDTVRRASLLMAPTILMTGIGRFEVERPFLDWVVCFDLSCPCGESMLRPGTGYLWVPEDLVAQRRTTPSLESLRDRITRSGRLLPPGATAPRPLCQIAARARGLDLWVAAADFREWMETGWVPLRPTPHALGDEREHTQRTGPIVAVYREVGGASEGIEVTEAGLQRLLREGPPGFEFRRLADGTAGWQPVAPQPEQPEDPVPPEPPEQAVEVPVVEVPIGVRPRLRCPHCGKPLQVEGAPRLDGRRVHCKGCLGKFAICLVDPGPERRPPTLTMTDDDPWRAWTTGIGFLALAVAVALAAMVAATVAAL